MIADLAQRIVEGFAAPRLSARRILAQGLSIPDMLVITTLGYLIGAIAEVLIPGTRLEGSTEAVPRHVSGLIIQYASLFAVAGLVYGFGRAAGGKGTYQQSCAILAWHSLVISFLMPIGLIGATELQQAAQADAAGEAAGLGSTTLISLLVFVGVWLWLLASYVSELHGFKSAIGVMGAIVAVMMGSGMMFAMALAGAG